MFDGRVLDMIELGIEGIKEMSEFEVSYQDLFLLCYLPTLPHVPMISQRRRDAVHPSGECNSYAGRHLHAPPNEGHTRSTLSPLLIVHNWVGLELTRQSPKSSLGSRPLMVFHSDLFDTHPTYQMLKSMLLDFYGGHAVAEIATDALEHVISITAAPLPTVPDGTAAPLPQVHFRVYTLKLLKSGTRAPRAELTEMGPSIDFSVRRVQEADEEMMKQAMKRPKLAKGDQQSGLGKKKKNIETDAMGDRVGKIHLVKQDLAKMQGRKMKGLKVHREKREAAAAASEGEAMDEE